MVPNPWPRTQPARRTWASHFPKHLGGSASMPKHNFNPQIQHARSTDGRTCALKPESWRLCPGGSVAEPERGDRLVLSQAPGVMKC